MKKVMLLCVIAISLPLVVNGITLEESITKAKKSNKTLQSEREEIQKYEQQYVNVRGSLLPQISLNGSYSLAKTRVPDSKLNGDVDYTTDLTQPASANDSLAINLVSGLMNNLSPEKYSETGTVNGQLKMDQVLFLGGKLINGIRVADKARSLQTKQYQVEEQDVIYQTKDYYYKVLLSNKLLTIQKEALATASQHLSRILKFQENGQVSDYDVLRAKLEVARLKPDVIAAQNAYDLSLDAFRKQIGDDSNTEVPEGDIAYSPNSIVSLDEAISTGKSIRTELKMTGIYTEIMQTKLNAERGNYLPNVSLSAEYDIFTSADKYAISKNDFGHMYQVMIGFQLPIFTGFSNTAKIAYARHELNQAKLKHSNTTDLIELEIRQAYQTYQHAIENNAAQKENLQLAEKGLQVAETRYQNQVGIQLEVLDAQLQLNIARLSSAQATYDSIMASEKLKKVMGYSL